MKRFRSALWQLVQRRGKGVRRAKRTKDAVSRVHFMKACAVLCRVLCSVHICAGVAGPGHEIKMWLVDESRRKRVPLSVPATPMAHSGYPPSRSIEEVGSVNATEDTWGTAQLSKRVCLISSQDDALIA